MFVKDVDKRADTIKQEEDQSVTVTEIEIYDTSIKADPKTGTHPVKARIKKRTDHRGITKEMDKSIVTENAVVSNEQSTHNSFNSAAKTIEIKPIGLWELIKRGILWAVACIVIAVALWIFLKLKKL